MDKQNSSRITHQYISWSKWNFFLLFWEFFFFEERGKPEWRRRPLFKKEQETASPLGYGPTWREARVKCSHHSSVSILAYILPMLQSDYSSATIFYDLVMRVYITCRWTVWPFSVAFPLFRQKSKMNVMEKFLFFLTYRWKFSRGSYRQKLLPRGQQPFAHR